MFLTLGAATKLLDNMMVNYSEWHTERALQGKKVNSVEETSSLSDKIDTIMLMLANDRAYVDSNNVPLTSLVAQEKHVDVNFIRHEHIVVVCLGCGPATAAAHLHRQRKPWSMSTPPPTTPEAEKIANIPSWANSRTGCGQRTGMCPEHLACAPLLTAGAGGAAGSRGLSAARGGGSFRDSGWYDGAGWRDGGEGGRGSAERFG
jgi:hypothetical protein